MKHRLKLLFEQITGLTVYKKLPLGQDPFDDIKYQFENHSFDLFFDIGANIGQSISKIREYFPDSAIWCFEPVPKTFQQLLENVSDKAVKCFQIGFGSEKSEMDILINENISSDRISFNENPGVKDKSSSYKERIIIETLDSFCKENNIDKIDYVKIDTEGFDLKVLKGAANLLENDKISFIETEVSMNPENTFHVRFEDVKEYLEKFEYRVYGIYEQVHEFPTKTRPTKKPILRRVNVLFISHTIYNSELN